MDYPLDVFVLTWAGVLTILSLFAGGTAIAASVLYRSLSFRKEIVTRRVLGARRSQIARMLLADNVIGVAAGILGGGVAVLIVVDQHRSHVVGGLILSIAAVAIIGMCGGWLAARHAVRRTDSDRRGHS